MSKTEDSAVDNNACRKEEILAISRKSKHDEGVESAENRGSRLGDYSVGVFGTLIAAFALFKGEFATAWAALLIVNAYALGIFLTLYRFTKRKIHFFFVVWTAIILIAFLALFLAAIYGLWIF
ncbi:MAG: DUF6442 family protein [Clostridiales bacterium]|jgi:hypothetical protein|nr:DUF6442 family protein [Clostridiales bacterium]